MTPANSAMITPTRTYFDALKDELQTAYNQIESAQKPKAKKSPKKQSKKST